EVLGEVLPQPADGLSVDLAEAEVHADEEGDASAHVLDQLPQLLLAVGVDQPVHERRAGLIGAAEGDGLAVCTLEVARVQPATFRRNARLPEPAEDGAVGPSH